MPYQSRIMMNVTHIGALDGRLSGHESGLSPLMKFCNDTFLANRERFAICTTSGRFGRGDTEHVVSAFSALPYTCVETLASACLTYVCFRCQAV